MLLITKSQTSGETITNKNILFFFLSLVVSIKLSHRKIFQTRLDFKNKRRQNTLEAPRVMKSFIVRSLP